MIERISIIKFESVSKTSLMVWAIILVLYTVWNVTIVGFSTEHIILPLFCFFSYYIHPNSRKVLLGYLPIIIYLVLYDSLKGFPSYIYVTVHIKDLYDYEMALFGISTESGLLTPNEYLQQNTHPLLDIITGLFYLMWMPIVLAFAFYLWFKDKLLMLQFGSTFLLVNLIAFVVYYLYPAAPPWYVEKYGFIENFNISTNAAGLVRFDQVLGIDMFRQMYTKGSNVFGAVPSMHSAFPMVVLFYGLKYKRKWVQNINFLIVVLGIWFAAVYSNHHYILDIIAGALCAVLGFVLFEGVLMKTKIGYWLKQLSQKV